MITDLSVPRPWRPPRGAALFFAALLLAPVEPAAVPAAEPAPATPAAPSAPRAIDGFALSRPPVLVGGAWKSFTNFLESTLNNRRRMLQFGVLGMCLALYIMIWRR